jgi:competence protein ComEA
MGHSKVNINQASAEEMASKLSGIGPVLAQRIVDYRSAQGPFQDIEDLKQVSGIGDKKYNDIKEMICVR